MRADWTIIFRVFNLFAISKTHPEDLKRGQKLHYGIVLFRYDKDIKSHIAREVKRLAI